MLYKNVSGLQWAAAGVGWREVLRTIPIVPWPAHIWSTLRASLWTGNNSYTSFSLRTELALLALLAAGLVLCLWRSRRAANRAAERTVWLCMLSSAAGLIYVDAGGFANSHGESLGAPAWHSQAMLMPLVSLVFLGFSRGGRAGRILAVITVLLWAYMLEATYWLKLVPWYGGFRAVHPRMADLMSWYMQRKGAGHEVLSTTCLVNAGTLFALLIATSFAWLFTVLRIARDLCGPSAR